MRNLYLDTQAQDGDGGTTGQETAGDDTTSTNTATDDTGGQPETVSMTQEALGVRLQRERVNTERNVMLKLNNEGALKGKGEAILPADKIEAFKKYEADAQKAAQDEEQLRPDWEKRGKDIEALNAKVEAQNLAHQTTMQQMVVDNKLSSAVAKLPFVPDLGVDVAAMVKADLKIAYMVGHDGQPDEVVVLCENGNPKISMRENADGANMSVDEAAEEWLRAHKHFQAPAGSPGTGTRPAGDVKVPSNITAENYHKLSPEQRDADLRKTGYKGDAGGPDAVFKRPAPPTINK